MNELGNTPADKDYKPSGISRAESRALEAYPDFDAGSAKVVQCFQRQCYINGYEQAEKDNELTWEDIWQIVHLYLEVNANHDYIPDKTPRLICEETLKRFKEAKK